MRSRRTAVTSKAVVALAVATLGFTAACGRSANDVPTGGSTGGAAAPTGAATSATTTSAGDFGTLKGICGPGDAKGATAKGVTDSEIRLGTTADPGAAAVPGLEQEFFDTGDAFVKWCNTAGGINGRKLVLDKWDAKLFNVGQAFTNACQKDFMLVGNGNAFDDAGVKPREDCQQGDLFAYTVGPSTAKSKYQVSVQPSNPEQYPYGPLRLLTEAYPEAKTGGVGIGSSTIASLIPQGLRIQQSLKDNGVKVTVLQQQPAAVANYRPYMEQMKGAGTIGLDQIVGQDFSVLFQAMKNVGWNPKFGLYSAQYYLENSVQAAKAAGTFPDSFVGMGHLAFEMDEAKYPVIKQVKDILNAAIDKPRFTDFTALSMSAWTLFAKEATACGSNLTRDCVLEKAQAETAWDAGGLSAPVALSTTNPQINKCWLLIKLTADGWQYDEKVTNPNTGPYNCDEKNVTKVESYQSST